MDILGICGEDSHCGGKLKFLVDTYIRDEKKKKFPLVGWEFSHRLDRWIIADINHYSRPKLQPLKFFNHEIESGSSNVEKSYLKKENFQFTFRFIFRPR